MNNTCNICPRNCNVDRNNKIGFCGTGNTLYVARAFLHEWEEPIISGTNGSGTVFFSGCSLKCVFCQNFEISSGGFGKQITVERLAQIFKELESQGAHNINLVTPTHYVPQIIEALNIYRPNIPIVYNSSGYETKETIALLKDYVDVYLTDIKFYSPNLSKQFALAENYFAFCREATLEMRKNQPQDVVENGIMKKGVIVRHLVLPGCTADSMQILNWIATNLGTNTIVSLMSQYTPCFKAKLMEPLNRTLKPIEYNAVKAKALSLGLHGFFQQLTSATEEYIPVWDFKGV